MNPGQRLKIESVFRTGLPEERIFLSENDYKTDFSFKHKAYYNVIRKIIPAGLRKKLQEKSLKSVVCEENFINTEYVDFLAGNFSSSGKRLEDITVGLYKNGAKSAIVLTHDVEEQSGFDSIPLLIETDRKYGFGASYNIVPYKYKIDKGIIGLIKSSGCETGIHGYNHDGRLYYSEKIFFERSGYINKALEEYGASGFRSPMVHRNLEWLQALNIKYDASCFDYDPYQPFPGGTGSIWPFFAGKFVELPYTLPQDHTMFYVLKVKDIQIWKSKIEWILKNGGVILVLTHPDYLLDRFNMKLYEELLDYLNNLPDTWRCLPDEFAGYWKNKFGSGHESTAGQNSEKLLTESE